MFINLIKNINTLFNQLKLNNVNINDELYFNIINNKNIENLKLNIFNYIDIIKYISSIEYIIKNQNDINHNINNILIDINNIKNLIKNNINSIEKEILLYFNNANNTEIYYIFDLFEYFNTKIKNNLLNIINLKFNIIDNVYIILKNNYNYDLYFEKLSQLSKKGIGISTNIIKDYNFINNKQYTNDIKKKNISIVSHNDYFQLFNKSINTHFSNNKNFIIKKNISQSLKINDIVNIKNGAETLLFNYFNIKSENFTNKSIFEITNS